MNKLGKEIINSLKEAVNAPVYSDEELNAMTGVILKGMLNKAQKEEDKLIIYIEVEASSSEGTALLSIARVLTSLGYTVKVATNRWDYLKYIIHHLRDRKKIKWLKRHCPYSYTCSDNFNTCNAEDCYEENDFDSDSDKLFKLEDAYAAIIGAGYCMKFNEFKLFVLLKIQERFYQ